MAEFLRLVGCRSKPYTTIRDDETSHVILPEIVMKLTIFNEGMNA
jgi:hypothetical protein